jgi:hypothetical protein
MATTIRARIYARGEVSFAKLVCQTVGGQFFLICQNYIDAKLVCQTVGVALRSDSSHVRLTLLLCTHLAVSYTEQLQKKIQLIRLKF